MAIEYLPADRLFTMDFYSEFCNAIRNINRLYEKFFETGYRMEGDLNGEWKSIEFLKLSEYSKQILTIGGITIGIILTILITIGITIIWNQRKIKKQLRQLLEEREATSSGEKKATGESDE